MYFSVVPRNVAMFFSICYICLKTVAGFPIYLSDENLFKLKLLNFIL